jgi:hypothetical protein
VHEKAKGGEVKGFHEEVDGAASEKEQMLQGGDEKDDETPFEVAGEVGKGEETPEVLR